MTPGSGVHIGVELGGTKVVVASSMSDAPSVLTTRSTIPTTTPEATLDAVAAAMRDAASGYAVASVGVGSFGPLDLREGSDTYGHILNTPKSGWDGFDLLGTISLAARGLEAPSVGIDTDVGAALLGERLHGAARGAPHAMYMTVGTGIGAAIHSNGAVRGLNHSEAGHVWVPPHPQDDYRGRCPYHGACLEGMASGPAIEDRFGSRIDQLDSGASSTALNLVSWYVGHGLVALIALVPVALVVIGGGVSEMPEFHAAVVAAASDAAGGYPPFPFASGDLRVVPPGLGRDAGVAGAIEVGRRAALDLDRE